VIAMGKGKFQEISAKILIKSKKADHFRLVLLNILKLRVFVFGFVYFSELIFPNKSKTKKYAAKNNFLDSKTVFI